MPKTTRNQRPIFKEILHRTITFQRTVERSCYFLAMLSKFWTHGQLTNVMPPFQRLPKQLSVQLAEWSMEYPSCVEDYTDTGRQINLLSTNTAFPSPTGNGLLHPMEAIVQMHIEYSHPPLFHLTTAAFA